MEAGYTIERIIYGDVLMVINFSMDFLSLYVTARLMKLKLYPKRLTLSAVLGALYSLLALYMPDGLVSTSASLFSALLMTFIAYGKQKYKDFIKNTATFYIVVFSLGGGITALCNLFNVWQNKRNIMINGTFDTVYGDIPFGLLVILGGICGLLSLVSGKYITKKQATKECSLTVKLNNGEVTLQALVDSGNFLTEPISGKPVIITVYDSVRKLIPIELISLFNNKDTTGWEEGIYSHKIRIIPTSTVNGKGLLLAFCPDSTLVDGKNVDVYVAVSSDIKDFSGFPAIVPAEIII